MNVVSKQICKSTNLQGPREPWALCRFADMQICHRGVDAARPCRRVPDVSRIGRRAYASLYGPSTGDRVRLADTNLVLRIERDFAVYGEESVFGGGKSIRDGMAQSASALGDDVPDTV